MLTWPHIPPGETQPFDAYLSGYFVSPEGDLSNWRADQVTSETNPDGFNFSGFSDPRIDAALDTAAVTDDISARAAAYRSAQELIAAADPEMVAWYFSQTVLLRDGMTSTDGPLDPRSWTWDSQLEDIYLAPPG